jgi:octaprenyl-diphosphate synthase
MPAGNPRTRELIDSLQENLQDLDLNLERALASEVPIVKMMSAHLNLMKGKRIRPTILLLICRAHQACGTSAVKAAVAIELLHTATLVHDDVIDDSDLRRGIETLNAVWGENSSVLMGDFIFARALNTLLDIGNPRLTPIFAVSLDRMSQGELLQVDVRHNRHITEELYFQIIRGKTSSLFGATTEIAGVLCGADDTTAERYRNLGESIGTAFQLTDDMLDYRGVSDVTGKPTGGYDFREGKITLPIIYAQRVAEGAERERLNMLIEDPDCDASWPEILDFVHRYGGLEYTMDNARRFIDEARQNLELLPASEGRDAIEEIMEFILSREH